MRLQAALQAQLDVSPSPDGQHPVIFLLDADRRFDRNLLTHWINAHPDPDREQVIVCLDLRDDRNPLAVEALIDCLLYTSPSPRDGLLSRMPSSA